MRFVLAIVSFVLAALAIGLGVAQRTVFAGSPFVSASVSTETAAPVTVIDGDTLNALDGRQTVSVSGDGELFAAYGRTSDVLAWVGDASVNRLSYDDESGELVNEPTRGSEQTVPDPRGSDLWYTEYGQAENLAFVVDVPQDVSLIIASDGTAPAPSDVSLRWPVDNERPWSTPLILGGAGLLLLGLVLLIWAIVHLRRSHGPRRKPPKQPRQPRMPKPPRQRRYKPKTGLGAVPARGRRSRRPFIAIPAVLAGALALGGCTTGSDTAISELLSGAGPRATPTPEATDAAQEALPPTAVTADQAETIIARIAETAAAADAANDSALLATRFAGPALEVRESNYEVRRKDGNQASLPAIPSGSVTLTLPQQSDSWPRSVFAVVQNDEDATVAPTALMLIQDEPRGAYKVHYAITLEPQAVLPEVAPASVGAPRLAADIKLLSTQPGQVAAAYADVLARGQESPSYPLFNIEGDTLLPAIGIDKKNERKGAEVGTTASLEFTDAAGTGETIAFATNDSGAIVAVDVTETETAKPTQAGAAVEPKGQVQLLSGVQRSTKGITASYGIQLLFSVPPVGGDGTIELLGYTQGIVSASEVP